MPALFRRVVLIAPWLWACAAAAHAAAPPTIVAAESTYGAIASEIGGTHVRVLSLIRNPNVDPHAFEASPSVAQTIGVARLVVQNGLGYDGFMNDIEAATASPRRRVIDVQRLLHLPDSTANPHLWYRPDAMPALAAALVRELSALQPAHHAYFAANARRFDASLRPWLDALARFRTAHPGAPVATTEPVGDYLLSAAGARNLTPWTLQADIMNGVDPAAQQITLQMRLLREHRVGALVYNQQVTSTVTQHFLTAARAAGVPVVGVYETMPSGYSYQRWMLAETQALQRAFTNHLSTGRL